MVNHALLLSVIWLVFSGLYDAFHLTLGAISVALVMGFNTAIRRLSPTHGGPEKRERLVWVRVVAYVPWLVLQIVSSALYVARLTLAGESKIDPCIVRFRSEQPNEVALVTLGNSITLTPGTLTLRIDERRDEFFIHALDQSSAEDVLDGDMARRVAGMWGGTGTLHEGTIDRGEDERGGSET
ncbi:MAG: Na+/H+ antiporter subunit E [Planctomycetota bacterium]